MGTFFEEKYCFYRTPCINRFSKGCNNNDTNPKPIGINVNIKKKVDKLYSWVIFSISPPT